MATAKKKTAAKKPAAKKRAAPKKKAPVVPADSKAKHTAMLKSLDPIAKEINHRLMQAEKLSGQSNDQRLSASLRMAEAKAKCDEVKLSFKEWCENHISLGYHNARKLAKIGAEGEDKARLLLEDLRLRSAEAQKKYVEKKKKLAIAGPSSSGGPDKTPFQRAEEVVGALTDNQKVAVIDKAARSVGRVVVAEDDAKSLVALRKKQQEQESTSPLTLAKAAFDRLAAKDKMALVQYAAKITGCTLEMPTFAIEDDDSSLDIPDILKRKKDEPAVEQDTKKPRVRRRKAA